MHTFHTAGAPPTWGRSCLPTRGSAQKINAEHQKVARANHIGAITEARVLRAFRDFIAKGNVIELAVAVVIGAASGKLVDSLVKDIIMLPMGLILGRVDFSNL